jgi:nitrate reductase delta subunit
MIDASQRQICADLSQLLAYPAADAGAVARRAARRAGAGSAAGAALARFAEAAEAATPSALQELYTATFDLRPACAPYLGVQLLGDESPVRGALLAKLAEVYAAEGFRPREELGDHVAEVLGFLAVARPGPGRDDLLRDGLLPALSRMIEAFEDRRNPYRDLLVAAGAALALEAAGASASAEVEP